MVKCDKCDEELNEEYVTLYGGESEIVFALCEGCYVDVKEFVKYGSFMNDIDLPFKSPPPISTRRFKLVEVEDETK